MVRMSQANAEGPDAKKGKKESAATPKPKGTEGPGAKKGEPKKQ
jgi:hypothetical protein